MDSTHMQSSFNNEGFLKNMKLDEQELSCLKLAASSGLHELCQDLCIAEKKCKDEAAVLQSSIDQLRAEQNSVQGDQRRSQEELAALSAKLNSLQTLLREKKQARDAEEQHLIEVKNEVGARQKVLDEIISQNENCVAAASLGVNLFEKHLGLSIRKLSSSNTTVFSFTQVQRADPSRVFEVAVTLEGNRYKLATDPPLPELPALQRRLNQTNNLAGFLGHVRKMFKKME